MNAKPVHGSCAGKPGTYLDRNACLTWSATGRFSSSVNPRLLLAATLVAATAFAAPPKKTKAAPAPAAKKAAPAGKRELPSVKLKSDALVPESAPAEPTSGVSSRGPTRIDFDDRLIQGQTNKSGSVYLYDRKELKTRSMVKKRESFRDEIITSLYDT